MTAPDEAKRIVAAYVAGDPLGDIAEAFGIGSNAVLSLVREAGVSQRVGHEVTSADHWAAMAQDGCERLLRRQLETGAYWGMTPAEARARLATLAVA